MLYFFLLVILTMAEDEEKFMEDEHPDEGSIDDQELQIREGENFVT